MVLHAAGMTLRDTWRLTLGTAIAVVLLATLGPEAGFAAV